MANGFNPLGSFQAGQAGTLALDSQRQGIARESAAAPVRNQLAQLGLEQAQTAQTQAQDKFGQDEGLRKITLLNQAAKALAATEDSQWQQAIPRIKDYVGQQGVDTNSLDLGSLTRQQLNGFIAESDQLIRDPSKLKQLTSGQRERADLMRDIQPALDNQGNFDPKKADARAMAAAQKLNLIAKPGTITGQERVATDKNLSQQVADSAALKSGATEAAKLGAQLKGKPAVQAAVASAVGAANLAVKEAGEAKTNATALRVYDTAMGALVSALDNTITGPFVGWSPALTSNQQIADGAKAAISPVLKQLFRSAGEGTFTDSDQKLLTDMIPTRRDRPAAVAAKLQNIDAIIRAKLNIPGDAGGSSEDKQAVEWARQNPNDPRAAAILQLNGVQ